MSRKRTIAMVLRDGVHVRRRPSVNSISLHTLLRRNAPAIVDAVDVVRTQLPLTKATYMRQTLFLVAGIFVGKGGEVAVAVEGVCGLHHD